MCYCSINDMYKVTGLMNIYSHLNYLLHHKNEEFIRLLLILLSVMQCNANLYNPRRKNGTKVAKKKGVPLLALLISSNAFLNKAHLLFPLVCSVVKSPVQLAALIHALKLFFLGGYSPIFPG